MTDLIMPAYEFPREMPLRWDGVHPFETASFDPFYQQSSAPTMGSRQQVANLGPDLWAMEFTSHAMGFEEAVQYGAWLQSLRGGTRLFKAWHPLFKYPQAYPNGWAGLVIAGGSTPFAGVAELTDIGRMLGVADMEAAEGAAQ